MGTIRTASVVGDLGDLLTIRVDPSWPHLKAFLDGNPFGASGDRQSFAFIDLEAGISEEAPPNYADTEVVGRAEQYKTFVGSANREYQFTIRFQAQGLPENITALAGDRGAIARRIAGGPGRSVAVDAVTREQFLLLLEKEVVNPALWLEALQHPVIGNGDLSHAPPPVLLTVGRLIPTVRCIVTGATPTWKEPFDPETLMPFAAEVPLTLTVVRRTFARNLFQHRRQYL